MDRYIVQQETRLEVVRAIENQRKSAQQFLGIFRADVRDDALDRYSGINGAQAAFGGDGFRQGFLRVGFLEQCLPLQVGRLDKIAVHDAQLADARAHQQICQRRSQRSAAYDYGRGFEQALLARLADFAEKNLPRIPFVGFWVHGTGSISRGSEDRLQPVGF